MATLRSDLIIPEVFTPYLIEETTQRDAFLQSGVVTPLAELNLSAERGGDFVKIPFYKANLTGDFEVLTDSTSLTPAKITADNQIAAVLYSANLSMFWQTMACHSGHCLPEASAGFADPVADLAFLAEEVPAANLVHCT